MSVTARPRRTQHRGRRRLHRADEAAGDVARGVHGAGRPRGRARPCPSGDRAHRADLHRGRRRRRGRAQYVVRRRYRRAHGAHRGAADPGRAASARRGAGLRPDAGGLLRRRARPFGQRARRGVARADHRFLRRHLYDVAQALDAAEHRHRRRGRRVAADDRLGGGDRQHLARTVLAVPHHLLLDAAAFLGAVALPHRRLCARRRADAAGGRGRRGNAPADPALHAAPRAARRCAVAPRLCRADLRHRRRGGRRRHDRAGVPRSRRDARPRRQQADVRFLDPLSVPAVCHAAGRPDTRIRCSGIAA